LNIFGSGVVGSSPGAYVTDTVCFRRSFASFDRKHRIRQLPPSLCSRDNQKGAFCVGPVFARAYVCRSCLCNAQNAFVMRHGVEQPKMVKRLPFVSHFAEAIRREYCEMFEVCSNLWLSKWPYGKQQLILKSVQNDPVLPGLVTSFVKREVYHDLPSRARLIQAYPNLATQEYCAREFYTFQKALASVSYRYELYPGIFVTMASGMNSLGLGAWMDEVLSCYGRVAFYERDGKDWDSTMQFGHHRTKLAFMRLCSVKLARFVEDCFKVVGTVRSGDDVFRYSLQGTVKSGHNDTTSGNSLVNMLLLGTAMFNCGYHGDVIVAGDDAIAVLPHSFDLRLLSEEEAKFGIKPKANKFVALEDVTFISGTWFNTGARCLFVPLLGRLLARLWWTVHPPSDRRSDEYHAGVALGLLAVCDFPVYRELLLPYVRASAKPAAWAKYCPYMIDVGRVDDVLVIRALCSRYGVSSQELIAFSRFLRDHPGPGFLSHPVADVIMGKDLVAVGDRPLGLEA
jgi:hypothetical protein